MYRILVSHIVVKKRMKIYKSLKICCHDLAYLVGKRTNLKKIQSGGYTEQYWVTVDKDKLHLISACQNNICNTNPSDLLTNIQSTETHKINNC